MATKLVLTYTTSDGTKSWNFNYADPTVTSQKVKSLVSCMIAYKTMFSPQPLEAKTAKLVTTTEEGIDIS